MLITTEEAYKAKITKRLILARNRIEQILLAVESDSNWSEIHTQIEMAVKQLRNTTKLLALYHLEVCVIGKYRKKNIPMVQKNIDEIIKTYRYLN